MRAPEDPRISALQGGEYVNEAYFLIVFAETTKTS